MHQQMESNIVVTPENSTNLEKSQFCHDVTPASYYISIPRTIMVLSVIVVSTYFRLFILKDNN